jgi:organic radical activating enzyme
MALPRIDEVIQHNPDLTHVTWIINDICPNRCVYCPPEIHMGSNHNYDWDNARQFVKELIARYPLMHLSLGGGEPSMSPFLPELVEMFALAGHTVSLTSNAYRTEAYWSRVAPAINQICFSYHPEFSTEQYFANVAAASLYTRVTCRVMMLSSHWDQCLAAFERLKTETYHNTEAVRITDWGTRNGSDAYTPDEIAWFNSPASAAKFYSLHPGRTYAKIGADYRLSDGTTGTHGESVSYINRGQTNFLGYECDIGLRSLFIGPKGQVKAGNCMAGGHIGSINKPELISWPTNTTICPYTLCGCVTDVNINKRRIPIIIDQAK